MGYYSTNISVDVDLMDIIEQVNDVSVILDNINIDEITDYIVSKDPAQIASCVAAEPFDAFKTIVANLDASNSQMFNNYMDQISREDADKLALAGIFNKTSASEDADIIRECVFGDLAQTVTDIVWHLGNDSGSLSERDIASVRDAFNSKHIPLDVKNNMKIGLEKIGLCYMEDAQPKRTVDLNSVVADIESLSDDDCDALLLKILKRMRTPKLETPKFGENSAIIPSVLLS